MTDEWRPLAATELPGAIAAWVHASPGIVRLAVDGPPAADPDALAAELIAPLRALGRPTQHVRADMFWRDASLRFEHGHEDVESYLSWLDADALRREVLLPVIEHGHFLPSLRDPATNRVTREAPRTIGTDTVLIVSGTFLLGLGLPFDRTVHLYLPEAARARRTPQSETWTLPAHAEYEQLAQPLESADVVIRLDRRTPAVRRLPLQ